MKRWSKLLIFLSFFISRAVIATECSQIENQNPRLIQCVKADVKLLKSAIGGCPILAQSSELKLYNPICLDQVVKLKLEKIKQKYLLAFSYLTTKERKTLFNNCKENQRHDELLNCLAENTPEIFKSSKYLFEETANITKSILVNQFLSIKNRNVLCFQSEKYLKSQILIDAFNRIKRQLPFHCSKIVHSNDYIKFKTKYLTHQLYQALDHPNCSSFNQCNFLQPELKIESQYFSDTMSPPIENKYEDGFVFLPWANLNAQQVKKKFIRMKKAGASHITFIALICQKNIHSSTPGECNNYKDELNKLLVWSQVAKELGLNFDITPFPYALSANGGWDWRGKIIPNNVPQWFSNYGDIVQDITIQAMKHGASYQTVATEMRSLHKFTFEWVNLAAKLRKITNKPLVMNVSWFEVPHMFWKAFDIIGISAYYPIAPTPFSSANTMILFWKVIKAKLRLLSKLYGKPIQFNEVGYPSANYGSMLPSHFDYTGRSLDLEEQRRAFEAFRKVWQSDKDLIRALIWATDVPDASVDRSHDKTYDPFNKPAMKEVEQFFINRQKLKK